MEPQEAITAAPKQTHAPSESIDHSSATVPASVPLGRRRMLSPVASHPRSQSTSVESAGHRTPSIDPHDQAEHHVRSRHHETLPHLPSHRPNRLSSASPPMRNQRVGYEYNLLMLDNPQIHITLAHEADNPDGEHDEREHHAGHLRLTTNRTAEGGGALDGISLLAQRENAHVQSVLDAMSRAEERRNSDHNHHHHGHNHHHHHNYLGVGNGHNARLSMSGRSETATGYLSETGQRHIFDDTLQDVETMISIIGQGGKQSLSTRSSPIPTIHQSPSPSLTHPSAQRRLLFTNGTSSHGEGSSTKQRSYASQGYTSSDSPLPPVYPHQQNFEYQDRGGNGLRSLMERDRNPTVRFLKEFIHANPDRRVQILNNGEWDFISSELMKKYATNHEDYKRENDRLARTMKERTQEMIKLSAPEKYIESIKFKAQRHSKHSQIVMERKMKMEEELLEKKVKILEQKEEARKAAVEARKAQENSLVKIRGKYQTGIKLWVVIVFLLSSQHHLIGTLVEKRKREIMKNRIELITRVAMFLQKMVRMKLYTQALKKKKTRSNPKYIMRYAAGKWSLLTYLTKTKRTKQAAADLITKFLKDCSTQAKSVLLIKNFRFSVIRIQRWFRSTQMIYRERLNLLLLQWKVYETVKRKENMSKKNISTLTKEQRKRIAEISKAGGKVDFQEFIKENMEKAKRSQISIPKELKEDMMDERLRRKLSEFRGQYRGYLRKTGQVPDRVRSIMRIDRGSDLSQKWSREEIQAMKPRFRLLLTKEELSRLTEHAAQLMQRLGMDPNSQQPTAANDDA